jgi:heme oxygenase
MESLLEEYKDHPAVKLIYFPRELNRKEALEKGIYIKV